MATTWEDYHLDRVYPYTALEKADIAERIWRQAGLRRPDHARQRPQLVVPTSIRFKSTEKKANSLQLQLGGTFQVFYMASGHPSELGLQPTRKHICDCSSTR